MSNGSESERPPLQRPTMAWWLWYALGGALPDRYRTWVLHDVTARTWVLRHAARSMVQLVVPVALLAAFLPVSGGIRVLTAFGAGLPALQVMLIMTSHVCEGRLVKAGYPAELGAEIRTARSNAAQRDHAQRYAAKVAARRAAS